jgi:hypothetical protein
VAVTTTIRLISFVVPAWNEERLLPRTLKAIQQAAQATGLPHQIVVADDDSSDATAEIARSHGAQVVTCSNRQIAATRNAGARAAEGDLLIFVDADTAVTPEAVCDAVEAIGAGATHGTADVTWDGPIPLWSRLMLRTVLLLYRAGRLCTGAFLFCTRETFERVGGFDESLYAAEEYYLSQALKKVGRFAWVKHQVVTSGRKLRSHSAGALLRDVGRLMFGGKKAVRSRKRLALWYEPRPPDPGTPPHPE